GRGGATGRAFTLVAPEDAEAIDNVEKLTGFKIPEMVVDLGGDRRSVGDEDAADAARGKARRARTGERKARGDKPERKPAAAPVAEERPEPRA
ncbi:hypothetical protein ACSTHO_23305, partial [Vibrio parahaemolyticus]